MLAFFLLSAWLTFVVSSPTPKSIFRRLIVSPLPPTVPAKLATIVAAHTAELPLKHLDDNALTELKRVPGISGTSVLAYLKSQEAVLIAAALRDDDGDDDAGDDSAHENSPTSVMTRELQQLVRWFALLLPLAESTDCPDGASLLDEAAMRAAAAEFFNPPAPVDRATYMEAVVALGAYANAYANRSPVGGAWNECNGSTIYTRIANSLRKNFYAPPPPTPP
jgi:hypothetical protein